MTCLAISKWPFNEFNSKFIVGEVECGFKELQVVFIVWFSTEFHNCLCRFDISARLGKHEY